MTDLINESPQIKEIETGKKDIEKNQAAAEAKAIAKTAILDRIGLTADELQTILG